MDNLKILKELAKDKTLSQRDLSKKLGLSLGKVNYVLNALIDKGLIKAEKFKNSKKKLAYMYILTPKGIKKKMELTYHFLDKKLHEYDVLRIEIEELKKDLEKEISDENYPLSQTEKKGLLRDTD
jgi:EPS-associated MarR family transcriptional regulator